jgi:hypothetical protein
MTDEQRLQMITEQLLIVRDNLFRGLSKSMQKLQAQSINEVLELPNYTKSPQRTWVGLTDEERLKLYRKFEDFLESDNWEYEKAIEAELKEKNNA